MFLAQIDKLISKSIQTHQGNAGGAAVGESTWKEIANTPSHRASIVTMYDIIFAIGGLSNAHFDEYTPIQAIHIYSLSMNSWVYISDLPSPITYSATVSLSPTEFLIIGGIDENKKMLSTVYK